MYSRKEWKTKPKGGPSPRLIGLEGRHGKPAMPLFSQCPRPTKNRVEGREGGTREKQQQGPVGPEKGTTQQGKSLESRAYRGETDQQEHVPGRQVRGGKRRHRFSNASQPTRTPQKCLTRWRRKGPEGTVQTQATGKSPIVGEKSSCRSNR